MSRPASSWSWMTACVASWYASSWLTSLNATRTSRPRSCRVYQCGLGYDPTIVVGSSVSTIFLPISSLLVGEGEAYAVDWDCTPVIVSGVADGAVVIVGGTSGIGLRLAEL